MNGKLQEKSLLRSFQISTTYVAEAAMMTLLGALAILLHAKFKSGMHIPGHHGIEFMALLVAGSAATRTKYSTMFFSLGVASLIFMPFMGFRDPFMAIVYTVPGFAFDFLQNRSFLENRSKWLLVPVAGIAYALIPLTRYFISIVSVVKYPSLISGVFYPFIMHFLFASLGAAAGLGLITLF